MGGRGESGPDGGCLAVHCTCQAAARWPAGLDRLSGQGDEVSVGMTAQQD